jgi:hypothetical protein
MPKPYKRKTRDRDPSILVECLTAIQSEGLSVRSAAAQYNLPEATVRRHHHAALLEKAVPRKGSVTSLPSSVEGEIAALIKTSASLGFGFSKEEVKAFVGDYVTAHWNNDDDTGAYLRAHCKFGEGNVPGEDWLIRFTSAHNLSLKKPSSLEKCRKVAASDPYRIYEFYGYLENVVADLQLQDKPHCIYNVDESAFFVDPRGGRVLGTIGEKTQRVISGTGRTCFTAMACISAAGNSLAPLIIFEGKHLYTTWKGSCTSVLPGTQYAVSGKNCLAFTILIIILEVKEYAHLMLVINSLFFHNTMKLILYQY